MNTWDKTRQDNKFKQKLQNVKSTLPKIAHCGSANGVTAVTGHKPRKLNNYYNGNGAPSGNNANMNNSTSPKRMQLGCVVKASYKRQNNLKFILREFGLSQYLRKLYEMGYDDHNYMKIGGMNQKKFEELIFNLKIFPGHQVKMVKLYEYLQSLQHVNHTNTNTNVNKKPNTSYGYSRYPITAAHTPLSQHNAIVLQSKPKAVSANTQRHYYPKHNDNVKTGNACINGDVNDDDGAHNYYSNNENKKFQQHIDNDEDVDRMLKYYMKQLNEKLDESYDSVDDSSLSHVNVTNDNIINVDTKEFNTFSAVKSNSLAPLGVTVSKGKNLGNTNEKRDIVNNNNSSNHTANNKRGPIKLPSITSKKANEEEHKATTLKPQQQCPPPQIDNIKHEHNVERIIKDSEDIPYEIQNNNDIQQLPPQTVIQQQQDIPIPEDETLKQHNNNERNDLNPQSEPQSNQANNEPLEHHPQDIYNDNDIYDVLRLNKSADEEYLRQNMEQFDIEYMCRCFGLAVMKHIEAGKDKQHITDILTDPSVTATAVSKEAFTFYSSTYNSHISFLFSFFNSENNQTQSISNLDRLELESDANSAHNRVSYINHFKQKKDEELLKHSVPRIIPRLHSDIGELERDIRFIDEIFGGANMKKKKNYYQFLSDKTKSILNKELSYINEVDSEVNISKINNSINNTQKSCEHNNNNNNIMISSSLLKQSNEEKLDHANYDNKFTSVGNNDVNDDAPKEIKEEVNHDVQEINEDKETFPSGSIESDYVISVSSTVKLKSFILKQSEVFDDDYVYFLQRIQSKKYVPAPDPQQLFEFCANIMCLTKMEKEVIIIALIYLERLTFNSGLLLTSRNWRRTIFSAMIIASKIWDDDSFENNHFAQIFPHLSIGEINLLERTFLELIGYKVHVKCSEYFDYFLILKTIALQYNYSGTNIIRTSVKRMMSIQEYAYQMQKKMKKRFTLSNSAEF